MPYFDPTLEQDQPWLYGGGEGFGGFELPEPETERSRRYAELLDMMARARWEANEPRGGLDAMALALRDYQPQGRPRTGWEAFGAGVLGGAARGFSNARIRSRGLDTPNMEPRMQMLRLAGLGAEHEDRGNAARERRAVAGFNARARAVPPKVAAPFDPATDPDLQRDRARKNEGLGVYRENPGTTPAVIQNPDGSTTIIPGGGKLPSAGEREKLTEDESGLAQIGRISLLFKPEYVGPGAAVKAITANFTDAGLSSEEADFRAALADFRNKAINRISGAAVSESEAKRMEQQLPNIGNPEKMFTSKLRQSEANLRDLATRRRDIYSRTGLNLSGLSPLPSGADSSGWKVVNGVRLR